MENVICPQCGNEFEVWTHRKDRTLFGGICRTCLVNVDIKVTKMTTQEILELAMD